MRLDFVWCHRTRTQEQCILDRNSAREELDDLSLIVERDTYRWPVYKSIPKAPAQYQTV